ncbi:hypothetical protein LPJ71_011001, partial [Coemansia sp. S17]
MAANTGHANSNVEPGIYRTPTGTASLMSVTSAASIGRQSYEDSAPLHEQQQRQQHHSQSAAQVDLTEIDVWRSGYAARQISTESDLLQAKVEEDYGRNLQKLAQHTLKSMDRPNPGHQSTQQVSWQRLVEAHETLASNRMKFSITLSEMSDFLSTYVKSKEAIRRKLRDTEQRYQKAIEESESLLEKARAKYEAQCGEWERLLLKTGKPDGALASVATSASGATHSSSSAIAKTKNVGNAVSGIFGKHKGSTQESLERMGQEAG